MQVKTHFSYIVIKTITYHHHKRISASYIRYFINKSCQMLEYRIWICDTYSPLEITIYWAQIK